MLETITFVKQTSEIPLFFRYFQTRIKRTETHLQLQDAHCEAVLKKIAPKISEN